MQSQLLGSQGFCGDAWAQECTTRQCPTDLRGLYTRTLPPTQPRGQAAGPGSLPPPYKPPLVIMPPILLLQRMHFHLKINIKGKLGMMASHGFRRGPSLWNEAISRSPCCAPSPATYSRITFNLTTSRRGGP